MLRIGDGHHKKILLIGGGGYIGTCLASSLLLKGYGVRVLDCLLYDHGACILPFLRFPSFEFMKGDFADPQKLNQALDGCTSVVILAGLVGDPVTKKYPEESCAINEVNMLKLIHNLNGRRLERVIFISTCSNYGIVASDVFAEETSPLKPLSLYSKAKVIIEHEILSKRGNTDYSPTILRFATAFGLSPRMRFDLTINEFVRDFFLGKKITVYDPDAWRPYCHVEDFAAAISSVLEADKAVTHYEVFNVGSEANNFTKRMIVKAIQEFLPEATVQFQEHGVDSRNYRVNFEKIKRVLKFHPSWTVRDGIQEILFALHNKFFFESNVSTSLYGNYQIYYRPPQVD